MQLKFYSKGKKKNFKLLGMWGRKEQISCSDCALWRCGGFNLVTKLSVFCQPFSWGLSWAVQGAAGAGGNSCRNPKWEPGSHCGLSESKGTEMLGGVLNCNFTARGSSGHFFSFFLKVIKFVPLNQVLSLKRLAAANIRAECCVKDAWIVSERCIRGVWFPKALWKVLFQMHSLL